RRQSLVAVPAAVDSHVFHRQRTCAAVLHRTVLAARLRELYARRCHAGGAARDLERSALPSLPRGAPVRSPAAGLHQLRPALEPVMQLPRAKAVVAVVIPCLNEEEPIAGVVREVLAQGVDEVVVVDNGSSDATAARARAAGAHVVAEPQRGYGRACAAGVRA